jgi:hypothetical protein
MLYKLKSLYVGGVILDYRKRYDELSKDPLINCSQSNLRKYISILKELNYAWTDKANKNLFLISKEYLKKEYEVSRYSHKIEVNQSNIGGCNLEYVMKGLSINENLERQKHVITKKLRDEKYDIVSTDKGQNYLDEKRDKKLLSFVKKDYDNLIDKKQKRYLKDLSQFNFKGINDTFFPFQTLSRLGLSKCVGRKSKATGTRLMTKLKHMGLIEKDDKNFVVMEYNRSYEEYKQYRFMFDELCLDYKYKFFISYNTRKRTIELRLPNIIQTTL